MLLLLRWCWTTGRLAGGPSLRRGRRFTALLLLLAAGRGALQFRRIVTMATGVVLGASVALLLLLLRWHLVAIVVVGELLLLLLQL